MAFGNTNNYLIQYIETPPLFIHALIEKKCHRVFLLEALCFKWPQKNLKHFIVHTWGLKKNTYSFLHTHCATKLVILPMLIQLNINKNYLYVLLSDCGQSTASMFSWEEQSAFTRPHTSLRNTLYFLFLGHICWPWGDTIDLTVLWFLIFKCKPNELMGWQ